MKFKSTKNGKKLRKKLLEKKSKNGEQIKKA